MLVHREHLRSLNEHDAAEFLGLAPKTLQNLRSTGKGPIYSRMKNGRIRYGLGRLIEWRDGDERVSTTQPYRDAIAP